MGALTLENRRKTPRSAGGRTVRALAILIVILCLLSVGCRKSNEPNPLVGRCGEIVEWTSPYTGEPVEESVDGKWEELGNSTGVYRAFLDGRVTVSEEGPQASASLGGKEIPLHAFTSFENLRPGEVMVVPGIQYDLNLSSALTNNGTETRSVVLARAPVRIMVTAKGKPAVGIAPRMLLDWNGERLKEFDVASTRYEPYVATAEANDGTNTLDIVFNNDFWKPPEDRNLYLGQLLLSQQGSIFIKADPRTGEPPEDLRIEYLPRTEIVDQYLSDEPAPGLTTGEPWRYYVAGNETRPAVPLPAPGKIALEIPSPWEEILLGFALIRTGPEWTDDTTVFQIAYERSGKTIKCGEITLSPKTNAEDQAWGEFRVKRAPAGADGKPGRLIVTSERRTSESIADQGTESGHDLPLVAQPIFHGKIPENRKPRNVILVSLDTLRGDHLSSLGYHRNTSPHLDRFGWENSNFVNAAAQASWTLPSHITMLTSLYPSTHGVFSETQSIRNVETVASAMAGHAYQTKAIVDGGFLSPEFGFPFGFDSYEDYDHKGFSKVMPAAEKWLRANGDRPFFLFLHTYDTHAPYRPPKEYRDAFPVPRGVSPELLEEVPQNFVFLRETLDKAAENPLSPPDLEYLVNMYDASIRYVDDQMQYLFDLLKELDLWDNTMIVVTSDHGEKFMERGLLGHKKSLYEEIVHVPLMMRVPDLGGIGQANPVVEVVDIAPTILDWAGVEPLPMAQGDSLLPTLRRLSWTDRPAFSEESDSVAYRMKNLKFIRWGNSESGLQLYDLGKDPGERTNIASEMPDVVTEMNGVAKTFRERNQALGKDLTSESAELSEGLSDELAKLGYLGR
jgi:arylsulfatase A-like enzyme